MEIDDEQAVPMAEEAAAPAEPTKITTPAAVLDLNPTGFVDDLCNVVELHCASGFDELDSALRAALHQELSPEQLTMLFQGTAGLYQDLRMELKNRMQTFEVYALEEILKVPPGLMAEGAAGAGGDASEQAGEVAPEQEDAVEAALKDLRQKIAASKRRARDMLAAAAELDRAMTTAQSSLAQLQAVPAAMAGRESLREDVKVLATKGAAVEASCQRLDSMRAEGGAQGREPEAGGSTLPGHDDDSLTDAAVEREILRQQAAVKGAPAEDLRTVRENLGLT